MLKEYSVNLFPLLTFPLKNDYFHRYTKTMYLPSFCRIVVLTIEGSTKSLKFVRVIINFDMLNNIEEIYFGWFFVIARMTRYVIHGLSLVYSLQVFKLIKLRLQIIFLSSS